MQHRDFPGGHPSQYYSGPKALNCRVLMGSGVVALVWPHHVNDKGSCLLKQVQTCPPWLHTTSLSLHWIFHTTMYTSKVCYHIFSCPAINFNHFLLEHIIVYTWTCTQKHFKKVNLVNHTLSTKGVARGWADEWGLELWKGWGGEVWGENVFSLKCRVEVW